MEAFSLLKFWKSSAAASAGLVTPLPAAATILTAENSDDEASGGGDDGPFFDLEFTGAVSDGEEEDVAEVVCLDGEGGEVEVVEESEMEELVKFRVSSAGGSGSERSDPNLPGSDLEEILAVESGSDPNSGKPLVFPVSLLRSATRLRILMSGFKRSSRPAQAQSDPKQPQQRKKLFTIKFKPGEIPIVSLFSRDHSSRPVNGVVSSFSSSSSSSSSSTSSSSSSSSLKPSADSEQQPPPASDEKLNPKDKVQKYIKMVKPLYIRVSKRYGEKLGFSGQLSSGSASPLPDDKPPEKEKATEKESEKKMQGNLGVGLKVMMKKRLSGKMKSPEAAVVHPTAVGRLPDDLVQQQEWIQGAILHCKRSFNAPRDEESASVLIRSASDPSHEKTVGQATQNDVVGGRQFNSPRECSAESLVGGAKQLESGRGCKLVAK